MPHPPAAMPRAFPCVAQSADACLHPVRYSFPASYFSSAISQALLQAFLNEYIQATVENRLGIANLDPRAQILDAPGIQHIGSNLAAPADIRLLCFAGIRGL